MADEMNACELEFERKSSKVGETCSQVQDDCDSLSAKKQKLLDELESMETPPPPETRRREMYSRLEMEALRFADTAAEQTKAWKTVYKGLEPSVRKEYDALASSKRNRNRPPKKDRSPASILGEACVEVNGNGLAEIVKSETDVVGPSDAGLSCGVSNEDECPAQEGDDSDSDDSDQEYGSIQRPAFLVEGEPNFDSGPPEDGLEYLRRVRWEAAKIPKVRVAKLDRSKLTKEQSEYMPKIPEIAKCPQHLLPSKQWEDAFLAEFSRLRLALSRLEISSSKSSRELLPPTILPDESIILDGYEKIKAHPSDFPDLSGSENENDQSSTEEDNIISMPAADKTKAKSSVNEDGSHYPLLSVVSKMDSVARVSMLKKRISSFDDSIALPKDDCLWLFALCAIVDTPLDADTCASLRSLLRKTASLLAQKSELDDDVVMLNILATISGRYFGQLEKLNP